MADDITPEAEGDGVSTPAFDKTVYNEVEFTDPCLGSVGSKPFLHHVQAQLEENRQAERMGRTPQLLPIQCGLCGSHHETNQLDAASVFPGTNFDEYAYERIVPKQNQETYIPEELIRTATDVLSGSPGGVDVEPVEVSLGGDRTK